MKILWVIVFFVLIVLAWSYWLPLEGGWLDSFLSHTFSAQLNLELSVHGTKVRHWDTVYFKTLEFSISRGSPKILSGPGFIQLKAFPFPAEGREKAVVVMTQIELPPDFYKKAPLSFLGTSGAFNQAHRVDRLRLSISKTGADIAYHLVECLAKDFSLQGSVTVAGPKISRVHALLLLRNELLQNLPDSFRLRLIQRQGGWQGLRVLYTQQTLIVLGGKDPFFKADWH